MSLRAVLNVTQRADSAPAVNYKTLLAFIALQCLALPFALLLSKPEDVKRDDGTSVVLPEKNTVKQQLGALWKACSTRKVGVLLPIFFVSLPILPGSSLTPPDHGYTDSRRGAIGGIPRPISRSTTRYELERSRRSSPPSPASSPRPVSASSSTRSASRSPPAHASAPLS